MGQEEGVGTVVCTYDLKGRGGREDLLVPTTHAERGLVAWKGRKQRALRAGQRAGKRQEG